MEFICIKCHAPLVARGSKNVCRRCGSVYGSLEEFPSFVRRKPFWGEVSQKQIDEIVAEIKRVGWERASKDYIHRKYPWFYEYMTEATRANCVNLFSPDRFERALDIGFGYGSITLSLSDVFEKVVGLEDSIERLHILKARIASSGRDNIELVHGDALRMPFRKDTFDAATIIGVLEWVGLTDKVHLVEEVQLSFLKGVYDVMREGGEVVIGIENRTGFQYLFGWKDHTNIWGTNLMPRALANLYTKLRLGEPYRAYTYSHIGYRKLMKKAGFKDVEIFCALRSYRFPKYIISLDRGRKAWDHFFRSIFIPKNTAQRVAAGLALRTPMAAARLLSPHFFIKARK